MTHRQTNCFTCLSLSSLPCPFLLPSLLSPSISVSSLSSSLTSLFCPPPSLLLSSLSPSLPLPRHQMNFKCTEPPTTCLWAATRLPSLASLTRKEKTWWTFPCTRWVTLTISASGRGQYVLRISSWWWCICTCGCVNGSAVEAWLTLEMVELLHVSAFHTGVGGMPLDFPS